ncbi:MAG: hypothetical protein ACM3ZV_02145 [Bacillota bacterium]
MDEYRVYFVDRSDGIVDARWLAAQTDRDALAEAEHLRRDLVREVWQKQRQIGRIPPIGEPD